MYDFLRGVLVECGPARAVLDVNGVGYRLQVPDTHLQDLPEPGATVTLFTELVVRDDAMELYGFRQRETRSLFGLVMGVAGVGPRTALRIVDLFAPAALARAVLEQEGQPLTRVPGIGAKTARRLALELKEKMLELQVRAAEKDAGDAPGPGGWEEAAGALLVLGYTSREAREAIAAVDEGAGDVEAMVKKALQYLGRKRMES